MNIEENYCGMNERAHSTGAQMIYDKFKLTKAVESNGYRIDYISAMFLKILPNDLLRKLPDEIFDALMEVGDDIGSANCKELVCICSKT